MSYSWLSRSNIEWQYRVDEITAHLLGWSLYAAEKGGRFRFLPLCLKQRYIYY